MTDISRVNGRRPSQNQVVAVEEQEPPASENLVKSEVEEIEKMLLLAVAYSASIGGTTTLIGTGPNLIGKEVIEDAFAVHNILNPINFATWMAFGAPTSFFMLILTWLWLQIYFYGFGYTFGCNRKIAKLYAERSQKVHTVFKKFYDELEPMKWPQYAVLCLMTIMVILLISRELESDPLIGWALVAPGYTSESTATIFIAVVIFIFPGSPMRLKNDKGEPVGPPPPLVNWPEMELAFPFGIILLIGGGIAAAECAKVSGLSEIMACWLVQLVEDWPPIWVSLVIIIFVIWVTEVMSNTACVTLMTPIFAIMAEEMGVNPLLYILPATVASSFAFTLPVATPPNAVVFCSGRLKILDMVKCGFVLNFIAVGAMFVATNLWGDAMFDFYTLPWDNDVNETLSHAVDCKAWNM